MRAMSASEATTRALVVDDDPSIADVVALALRHEGFDVDVAATGGDALASVAARRPDVIVLDVMLPDMDGFEVLRRIGERRAGIPVLFLTARDTTEDKVRGLTIGGDDYVTKPFSLEELVARVRTILRRRTDSADAAESRLTFADVVLDEETHEVFRANKRIELAGTEYRLLRFFLLNPRRALTRAQILDQVWDYDFGGDARVLETYVSYLRKKLEADGPRLVHTVRGVGYALRDPRD
jgi:two-component system, OmpR family, response regulator